jgi:MFS transporter, CP family, cyanate transporter
LLAVLVAGLNMRAAIAAVGPVLPEIRQDLALSPTEAGLLTALPVLCFAVLAPPVAWAGRRLGVDRALVAGLLLLALATALRVVGGPPALLIGTALVGAGMTVGNVLMPPAIKREFGIGAGRVTGLYTTAMATGAALTAALTAPLAVLWGWRVALGIWAGLALLAAALWQLFVGGRLPPAGPVRVGEPVPAAAAPRVWREPVSWAVAVFLGLQSVLYYSFTTWLPTVLVEDGGRDLGDAAVAATVFQLLGIGGALLVPLVIGRLPAQRMLALVVAGGWATIAAGLLLWPAAWPVWTAVGGLTQGAGVSLAFTLIVLRGADDDVVRRIAAMAQLVAYPIGAAGPLAVGALNAATSGWSVPLAALVGCAAVMAVAGVVAGRPVVIGANR